MGSEQRAIRVIFTEVGSALSGRDTRCEDGVYRKGATFFQIDKTEEECIAEARRRFADKDIYAIRVDGPYSLTTGD